MNNYIRLANQEIRNKKQSFLLDYIKIADLHADRLQVAMLEITKLFPINTKTFSLLKKDEIAFLDMTTTRFGKLQDIIGAKIFPLILDILGEDNAPSFRDKLNRLEKLNIIHNANWWMDLREIRNQITHDYLDDYDILSKNFNMLIPIAKQLLVFWDDLKKYLVQQKF